MKHGLTKAAPHDLLCDNTARKNNTGFHLGARAGRARSAHLISLFLRDKLIRVGTKYERKVKKEQKDLRVVKMRLMGPIQGSCESP